MHSHSKSDVGIVVFMLSYISLLILAIHTAKLMGTTIAIQIWNRSRTRLPRIASNVHDTNTFLLNNSPTTGIEHPHGCARYVERHSNYNRCLSTLAQISRFPP